MPIHYNVQENQVRNGVRGWFSIIHGFDHPWLVLERITVELLDSLYG